LVISIPNSLVPSINEITTINRQILNFWKESDGWAPQTAAQLLFVSRLDWQVSLSEALEIWSDKLSVGLTDGQLILAWANLGALVEGSMKLLLVVYYENYIIDTENIKKAGAYNNKKNAPKSPDSLQLEQLKIYFREQKLLTANELLLVEKVQKNRNILHAFQDATLDSSNDFIAAVYEYLSFLKGINSRLPYPSNY
jgi:DNA-binding transcriptional regulator of glucitol operon